MSRRRIEIIGETAYMVSLFLLWKFDNCEIISIFVGAKSIE